MGKSSIDPDVYSLKKGKFLPSNFSQINPNYFVFFSSHTLNKTLCADLKGDRNHLPLNDFEVITINIYYLLILYLFICWACIVLLLLSVTPTWIEIPWWRSCPCLQGSAHLVGEKKSQSLNRQPSSGHPGNTKREPRRGGRGCQDGRSK